MNKAILVMDMPSRCNDCACCGIDDFTDEYVCGHNGEMINYFVYGKHGKPKWCPLKEMPNKKPHFFQNKKCFSDKDKGYFLGWNDCLEEILGDEDE